MSLIYIKPAESKTIVSKSGYNVYKKIIEDVKLLVFYIESKMVARHHGATSCSEGGETLTHIC